MGARERETEATARVAWLTSALGATALDLRATVTPEMMATVAASPPSGATDPDPRPSLGIATSATLPRISVHMPEHVREASDRAPAPDSPGADLVVRHLIAEGGMGLVFAAEQRSLARAVAIKTVKDAGSDVQRGALLWEGAITGHLDHPGVTPVHLLGTDDIGRPLLVMKNIVGVRWADLIADEAGAWDRVRTLPRNRLKAHLDILLQVARTVHYAHTKGVLHLDIKPDNVMIGELGEVYVVDWGVAVMTKESAPCAGFVGTPVFIAPEVVEGEPVGPFTDVYLLGATLHAILTGKPRHAGETITDVLVNAVASTPFPYASSVPHELAELANLATARDPTQRPKDAISFRDKVADHLEHTASLALSRQGIERLAMLDDPKADATRAGASIRIVTEARFALRSALDRWPENPEAIEGFARCLVRWAELELARENVVGAREVFAEMDHVPPELAERLAALEEKERREAASVAELASLRRETDLGTGRRDRTLIVGALVLVAVVFPVVWSLSRAEPFFPESAGYESLIGPAVAVGLVGAGVLVFRRRLLVNTVAKRLLVCLAASALLLIAHRAAFLTLGAVSPALLVGDLFIVASFAVNVGIFVTRRAWWVGAFVSAAALLVTLFPRHAAPIFMIAAPLSLLLFAMALRPSGRDR